MTYELLVCPVGTERDFVAARQRAREVAGLVGFDPQWQTRIATAVSEIARNAVRYAGGGSVTFSVELDAPQTLWISIEDRGPGIARLDDILDGRYRSTTGMGMGIVGTKRLIDDVRIETWPGRGTRISLGQPLPKAPQPLAPEDCAGVVRELATSTAEDPLEELQRQNREMLATLNELKRRQAELDRLNAELEDTNRGVVALYAELEDKADSLKRASESKSRFLSNMTHEFRTPLNSIHSLADMLLERTDGDLTTEQERQILYIRKSANDLTALVNDLLDLAKVEAGKVDVRPSEFEVSELFGALKGVLRPLLASSSVALVFDEPAGIPTLETDEGKLSQILRNFISNALKYTEHGEVRVSARPDAAGTVTFAVRDTGIGIALEDQERIFEEFAQVEGPHQRRAKGTGLGLALSLRLAELLGGSISLVSSPGEGSTFSVTIPARLSKRDEPAARWIGPELPPILAVDESEQALAEYSARFDVAGFRVVAARTLAEARAALEAERPAAVVTDVLLGSESAWPLVADLKASEATRDIPVVVVTPVENREKAIAAGADEFALKPVDTAWLVARVGALVGRARSKTVLVVDDDEVSRYVLRDLLGGTGYALVEAASGAEGLRLARERRPDALFLDLAMPEMSGEDVLAELKASDDTRGIPVIVYTSEPVEGARREALLSRAVAVVAKYAPSREAAIAEVHAALSRAGLAVGAAGRENSNA